MRTLVLLAAALGASAVFSGPLAAKIAEKYKVSKTDVWYGGERTVFDFEGYEAWVVEPPAGVKPAEGRPWTWTMQWKTAFVPRTSVPRLLKMGYHHVTVDTFTHHMDATGLAVSKRFQDYLVGELALAPKARLIGLSWGGFFSIRYAANFPDRVARIYLDAPLLCFDAFRQMPPEWESQKPASGWWTDSPEMPINMTTPIAHARIPILLLYGGVDMVVPPIRNAELFAGRFKAAGGDIKVVCRKNYAHHPHGVEESESTIIDFFEGR